MKIPLIKPKSVAATGRKKSSLPKVSTRYTAKGYGSKAIRAAAKRLRKM